MQVRIARHTSRLDEVVRFCRDGLGAVTLLDPDGFPVVLVPSTWS